MGLTVRAADAKYAFAALFMSRVLTNSTRVSKIKIDRCVENGRSIIATKRERTRESIIKESYTLFAGKGFKQVTMKDVCEITGMSRGGLYSHFSGTDKLFEAVLEKITEKSVMDFQTEIKEGTSSVKILEKALDNMEEEMKHPEDSLSIALYEYAETVNTDVMERLERNAKEKWKLLIHYGVKRGEFQDVNVDEIVNMILYSYQGVRMWSRIIPMKPKTIRSITDHIRKQLTGGQK